MQPEPEKIETQGWRDNKLEMIDQRILPAHFEYLAFDSAATVAEAIRSMVVRGAPAIGCAAAYGFALGHGGWNKKARRILPAGWNKVLPCLLKAAPLQSTCCGL